MSRPPFYETVEEMEVALTNYFKTTPIGELTVTGLAIFLGFTSRQALLNYECKSEFIDAIKKAKLIVENDYEVALRKNGRSGDIFGLKNFGWKDAQDVNLGGQEGNPVLNKDLTKEESYKQLIGK